MAFRISGGARIHAVASAEIIAGTCRDRANDHDSDQQEYPSPLRHFRDTFPRHLFSKTPFQQLPSFATPKRLNI
jgi:hypothetical protein